MCYNKLSNGKIVSRKIKPNSSHMYYWKKLQTSSIIISIQILYINKNEHDIEIDLNNYYRIT